MRQLSFHHSGTTKRGAWHSHRGDGAGSEEERVSSVLSLMAPLSLSLPSSVEDQSLPARLEIVDVEKKKGLSKYYVSH